MMIGQLSNFIIYDDMADKIDKTAVLKLHFSQVFYIVVKALRFCGFIRPSSLHGVEAHGRLRVADAAVAEDVVRVVEDELLREDVVEVPEYKWQSLNSPANFELRK